MTRVETGVIGGGKGRGEGGMEGMPWWWVGEGMPWWWVSGGEGGHTIVVPLFSPAVLHSPLLPPYTQPYHHFHANTPLPLTLVQP